ncbi:hypothetical protein H5410_015663 [Solanum commersonii]|uniref:Serine-threonine/tyrosine-protein kinase catalytic domain-containing protein n=1 Tax=Solanum commersonii TaxID=4109 RepID=A0A9J5ZV71_SOLCO|nr:hypothetical protein H5410_015663 [Solanum commersonii]
MFTYTPSSSSLMFHIIHQSGCWAMKSDVYIFGLLLVELITKTKLHSDPSVFDNCKPNSFVHKSFEDACRCVSADPSERPTMKMVLDDLNKLKKIEKKVEGKRKRDENESTIE